MMFPRPTQVIRLPRWLAWIALAIAFALTCVALLLTPIVLVVMLAVSSVRSLFGVQPHRRPFTKDAAKLIACPLCGLCVTAIPDSGTCPECGSGYDPHGDGSHPPHHSHSHSHAGEAIPRLPAGPGNQQG